MGERNGCDPGGVRRLRVAQPTQLCRREGRDGHGPGAAYVLVCPHLDDQVEGGWCAPRVVPQQRWTDNASRSIQDHHAVLLCRDRHGRDVVEPAAHKDRGQKRIPPGARIHLRTLRMRRPPGAHQ